MTCGFFFFRIERGESTDFSLLLSREMSYIAGEEELGELLQAGMMEVVCLMLFVLSFFVVSLQKGKDG